MAVIFFVAVVIVFAAAATGDPYIEGTADMGMIFTRMNVSVDWSDDRSCKVVQDIEIEFETASHGIYVDIPVNSGEKVRDLRVITSPSRAYTIEHQNGFKLVRAKIGDEDIYFRKGDTFRCIVKYDYITPEHARGKDVLALMAIGRGWTSYVQSATVNMTYPVAPEKTDGYGIWVAGEKCDDDDGVVSWSNDGKTVTVTVPKRYSETYKFNYALAPFEGVEIAYKLPDGTLKPYTDREYIVTLIVGAALLAAAVALKLIFRNKALSPTVDFYPPYVDSAFGKKRMLPVQMGKIIDNVCSDSDITSLIFYWAGNGFLSIDERENDTYLIKNRDLEQVTDYERTMFDKLFASAATREDGRREVGLKKLSGRFSTAIINCKNAVNREYRYDMFYKKFSLVLSYATLALTALYAILVGALGGLRIGFINLPGVLTAIPVAAAAVSGIIISRYYFKLGTKKRKLAVAAYIVIAAMLSFGVSFAISRDIMGWAERIIFAVCVAAPAMIAPFLSVRTDWYNEQLNAILGFRDFLRDAEKERLELLLADDPQYYYSILPYANVLGVSDIWADKFKGITLAPPDYYSSYLGFATFDCVMMHGLTRSVGSKLSYNPSGSSGSFSGGSFGGGGGFSGGSFGGGGGGRW